MKGVRLGKREEGGNTAQVNRSFAKICAGKMSFRVIQGTGHKLCNRQNVITGM